MFRFVCLSVISITASAATMMTTVTCNALGTTTTYTGSASCGGYSPDGTTATAGPTFAEVQAWATYGQQSGDAVSLATYAFTVIGGTGNGFFLPCLYVAKDVSIGGTGWASASFATFSNNNATPGGTDLCVGATSGQPFTFGQTQVFSGSFAAHGQSIGGAPWGLGPQTGGADATLRGFLFWDAAGHPLSDVSYTLIDLPEPSSFTLVALASASLLILRRHSIRRATTTSKRP